MQTLWQCLQAPFGRRSPLPRRLSRPACCCLTRSKPPAHKQEKSDAGADHGNTISAASRSPSRRPPSSCAISVDANLTLPSQMFFMMYGVPQAGCAVGAVASAGAAAKGRWAQSSTKTCAAHICKSLFCIGDVLPLAVGCANDPSCSVPCSLCFADISTDLTASGSKQCLPYAFEIPCHSRWVIYVSRWNVNSKPRTCGGHNLGLRVCRVVLLPLYKRFNVLRRNQLHLMADLIISRAQ